MPKARRKKNTEFKTSMTKSVFLFGVPNKEKAERLRMAQDAFTSEANRFIGLLSSDEKYLPDISVGNSRTPSMRAFEKVNRNKSLLSATFSQAAFDDGFTKLANRMDNIRKDVMRVNSSCLVKSKMLFGLALIGKSKAEMIEALITARNSYKKAPPRFDEWIDELNAMSDFDFQMAEIRVLYDGIAPTYKVPYISKAHVRLVSTNFKFSLSDKIKAGAVIEISIPNTKGYTEIPLIITRDGRRRLEQYGACSSAEYTMQENGLIRVSIAFEKKLNRPGTTSVVGVDAGISDALHTSEGGAVGTLSDVIAFYKEHVETLFAEKSNLLNKKRKLVRYLKAHPDVPDDVKKAIRDKIDRLEASVRKVKKAYRTNRRYHAMLKKRIKDVVSEYIRSLNGDKSVLTAVELLDIKEFNKSRKQNGMHSMFARGLLSEILIERLNWAGYDFIQVDPAYTSQCCPVCGYTHQDNRKGKDFSCQYCGHMDDADHVGSVNIKVRALDDEMNDVCTKHKYNQKQRQRAIKELCDKRHAQWVGVKIKPAV